ncbi:MAG TPA: NUDIX hydrolase [Caulobacteraceae bacterium]|nr:NUDIX hydrolase [Caulobacteraceae bacterium]
MKKAKAVGIQYAALPYRVVRRRVEVMLITSRGTRRWVIPKGWPMAGLKPQEAAAVEAMEEAGVSGQVEDRPIGSYRYMKVLKEDQAIAVQVILFPLLVTGQEETWKEQGQREPRWFRYQRAATLVAEPSLRRLIREFGRLRTPGVFASAHRLRLVGLELLHLR